MINVLRSSIDGATMSTVTVSPKYQIVIPQEIRQKLEIKPGNKIHMMVTEGVIHLVKVRPIEEMRGIAKGMDTHIEKEKDRF